MISLMNLIVDIIEGLSYIEVTVMYKSNVDCAGIYVRILFLIVYFSEAF